MTPPRVSVERHAIGQEWVPTCSSQAHSAAAMAECQPADTCQPDVEPIGSEGFVVVENQPEKDSAPPAPKPIEFPSPVTLGGNNDIIAPLFAPLESGNCESLAAVAYDHMLLSARLFLDPATEPKLAEEVLEMLRTSLRVSATMHAESMDALCPPELKSLLCTSTKSSVVISMPRAANPQMPLLDPMGVSLQYLRDCIKRCDKQAHAQFLKRTNAFLSLHCVKSMDLANSGVTAYPLMLRAVVFATVLGTLYHDNQTFALDPDDISCGVHLMKERLAVTDALATCCRVHSIFISHSLISEGQSAVGAAPETHNHFLSSLADTVRDLASDSDLLSVEEKSYRRWLLQRCMSLVVPVLTDYQSHQDPDAFRSHAELFAACTDQCSVPLMALCFGPNLGDTTHFESARQVALKATSVALCAPLYRELADSKDSVTTAVPLDQIINVVIGMHDAVLPYTRLLAPYFPNATALAAPGLVRMLAVVLKVHWSGMLLTPKALPLEFGVYCENIMQSIANVVLPAASDGDVMAVVAPAFSDFDWMMEFAARCVEASKENLRRLYDAMMRRATWNDAKLGQGAHSSSLDLFAMFFGAVAPLPSILLRHSQQTFGLFLSSTMELLEEYVRQVCAPFSFLDPSNKEWQKQFAALQGHNRVRAVNRWKGQRAQGLIGQCSDAEVVLRLNTLIKTKEQLAKYFSGIKQRQAPLASITNTPPLDTTAMEEHHGAFVQSHIQRLCEYYALKVVYRDLNNSLMVELYRLDIANYKDNKHNEKALSSDPHAHLAFSNDLTVGKVLEQLDRLTTEPLASVQSDECRQSIISQIFLHFVVEYYDVLISGGPTRFFYPEQNKFFFDELCTIEKFFLGCVRADDNCLESRAALGLLSTIKVIVSLVMSKTTQELLTGSDTSEPYATLPLTSPSVPFTKEIVYNVLSHRKDPLAKKFISSNAPPQ